MAINVPNTTTFSLQNVVDAIGGTTASLVDAFANANSLGFDGGYCGTKTCLLNFRNYIAYSKVYLCAVGSGTGTIGSSAFVERISCVNASPAMTAGNVYQINFTECMKVTSQPLNSYVSYSLKCNGSVVYYNCLEVSDENTCCEAIGPFYICYGDTFCVVQDGCTRCTACAGAVCSITTITSVSSVNGNYVLDTPLICGICTG